MPSTICIYELPCFGLSNKISLQQKEAWAHNEQMSYEYFIKARLELSLVLFFHYSSFPFLLLLTISDFESIFDVSKLPTSAFKSTVENGLSSQTSKPEQHLIKGSICSSPVKSVQQSPVSSPKGKGIHHIFDSNLIFGHICLLFILFLM